jgi:hypothetical protein
VGRREAVTRRLGSYERACEELGAASLRADPGLPSRPIVQFGADPDWLEQLQQAAQRGLPPPIWIKAYPLSDRPARPEVVAEFAAAVLLIREGRRLRLAQRGERPKFVDRANLRWICWGDLIVASPGALALAPLSIAPWPGAAQRLEAGAEAFTGVTSDVLRAIRPDVLIAAIVDHLEELHIAQQHRVDRHGTGSSEQARQQLAESLSRARSARRQDGRSYPDSHYRDIALLYLDLLAQGHRRRITQQLADQLGISTSTARNWIHRARQLEYITPAQQGQPGAHPGPRLTPDARDAPTR